MKVCRRCKEEKDSGEFGSSAHFPDGLQGECLECRQIINEIKRRYRKRTPGTRKSEHLMYLYKITLDQYNDMLDSQNGKCAICETHPGGKMLAVDHDHKCCPGRRSCGKCIRGLLCQKCNLLLGRLEENAGFINSAIRYLVSD